MKGRASFGGRYTDRFLIDFEPTIDGAGDPAGGLPPGDPVADAPPADPVADAPPADAPPAPATPAPPFTLDDVVDLIESRLPSQQQPQRQPDGQQQWQDGQVDLNELLNPLNDDFGANLIQVMQQVVQQAVTPIGDTIRQQQDAAVAQRGEQRISEIIDADVAANGAFAAEPDVDQQARQTARDLALAYLPQMEQRWGQGNPRAAEAALQRSLQSVRALSRAQQQAGAQQNVDDLQRIAGAPASAGGGGGTVISMPPAPRTPDDLMAKFFGSAA